MENVGKIDRLLRFVIAIVFIIIGLAVSAWWFLVAAYALATALLGQCGLYTLFGTSTHVPVPKKMVSRKKR